MAKNLKVKIKNAQLAEALNLDKLKKKKKEEAAAKKSPAPKKKAAEAPISKEPAKEEKAAPPPPPPETEKVAKPEPKVEKPAPEEKPKAKPVVVDDFRKPKIIRRKAAPIQRLPVTRKESPKTAKPGEKKPAAKSTSTEKPKTTTQPSTPSRPGSFKDFREVRSQRKPSQQKSFDARDRMGLRDRDDDRWRKRRNHKKFSGPREDLTIRPKALHLRLPITVKDLAVEMKLKASQLISKLFAQGMAVTINDFLDDETTVQLLGHEFQCEITIDTSEEERIKITDKTIKEEIAASDPEQLVLRPPVITFMGHVDHGKTSLIDAIRKSDITAGEAGAITQHIGAFKCSSAVGDITILDTPGHEAFSAMRERGAEVTDLVVLVIAGDEGMRDQTVEALNKAKEANVPIVVAINKSDKPGYNAENIYRELSEHELLPEAWGGTTITVNCSATSGEGVKELLEMLSLQSEVLELKADPAARARGSVVESAMHKGLGSVATLLVQNGTLKIGDPIVFDVSYAKVKTMHDEHGNELKEAAPSTPVKITGLSGLLEAGSEFIAVSSEKEARNIASVRKEEHKHKLLIKGKRGLEALLESKAAPEKKVLHVLLRADVQGSLEALRHSLEKIKSDKAELNIVSEGIGQISESDIALAGASGAVILGFHTKVESHAESLIKEKKVTVKLHDIIYHAVDDIKELMRSLLDKLEQENDMGSAEVKAVFKSSHLGRIAGCQVNDGIIKRSHHARLKRNGEVLWKGQIASLKREKEDVREISKGLECGILLQGFNEFEVGDIIESYEITYLEQEL
ncbi:MAG: translation initiation factor IF-2 [Simkaniaceae bacterium]|nr:translation initiation factor IF-2 [Candidatus Sacchlamyda saccharinae]